MKLRIIITCILLSVLVQAFAQDEKSEKVSIVNSDQVTPNFLFVVIDDLRPELNCYGKSQIVSPNIDQLANEGLVFNRAYCNVPVCGASRASFLTGLYPTEKRFVNYHSRVDDDAPGFVTIPEYLKNKGYYTSSLGKIFHHPDDGLKGWSKKPFRHDYPNSLSQQEQWGDYQLPENSWTKKENLPRGVAGPAWECAEGPDSIYYSGKATNRALTELENLAQTKQPFFFALGYIRPHLPFNAPKKYWDLYDHNKIETAANSYFPANAPKDAWFNFQELRGYSNIPNDKKPLNDDVAKMLRHGYYASVSFIDAQVGKVVHKLKELNLYESTVIVLMGDHGWSLGEHALWCKHSCFNNALQVPLIIKSPKSLKAEASESLVSYVDLFPTICDLAGLEKPVELDGKSLVPILNNPQTEVNQYVFSRYKNGETLVTDRYSYTEYFDKKGTIKSSMLFDHQIDPDENNNLVFDCEYAQLIANFKIVLQKHISNRR